MHFDLILLQKSLRASRHYTTIIKIKPENNLVKIILEIKLAGRVNQSLSLLKNKIKIILTVSDILKNLETGNLFSHEMSLYLKVCTQCQRFASTEF